MERRTFLTGAAGLAVAAAATNGVKADTLPLGPLPNTRYPDPRIEVLDRRFHGKIGNTYIERIATGFRWCEGPCYVRDGGYLLWSDIPNNRIMRWSEDDGHVSVFRQPSNYSNGHTRDREGRLISCEHDSRRVTRTEHDGSITVLMDNFQGKKLNAPNDVVVGNDGAVWFTDPGFGKLSTYESDGKAPLELPPQVYRLDPRTKQATVVYTPERGRPNGIAFTPDEKKLYIIDSALEGSPSSDIRIFDVAGEKLTNGKIFAADFTNGGTDGMKVDTEGNVWCSVGSGDPGQDGVRVYAPDGTPIAKIHLPETCANLCFGGKKKNRLFMCGSTSIYAVYVDAIGAMVP
jgi:gluconolactonase